MALLDGFRYRCEITIDNTNIDSDLTYRPHTIYLSSTCGQANQDLTKVFDEIGSDYLKIAVTKSDGTTQIYGEIEPNEWDSVNKECVIRVSKSDLIFTSELKTKLFFYFDADADDNTTYIGTPGNRPEIWSSDFIAAYTMAQDPSAGVDSIIDSTVNENHGTPQGDMNKDDLVPGVMGKALEFDGVDDYIDIPEMTLNNNKATIGGRFYIYNFIPPDNRANMVMFARDKNISTYSFLGFGDGHMKFEADYNGSGGTIYSDNITKEKWFDFILVFNNDMAYMYVDGILEGSISLGGNNLTVNQIGHTMSSSSYESGYPSWFDGKIEDVFVCSDILTPKEISMYSYSMSDNLLIFEESAKHLDLIS